jgi:RNA polymerase sigma factor (sigma-70 family)
VVEQQGTEGDRWIGEQVLAARAGDPEAFSALYRGLAGKVAAYARRRGVADVDDVVNDVFMGAYQTIDRFSGDGSAFRAWLFTIAHHKVTDWLRAPARRAQPHDLADRFEHWSAGDAEVDAMAALGDDDVAELLALLTDDQRDVLLLRVVADMSLEQTAAAMDKSVGAVKALQHRAVGALQRAIDPQAVSR